MESLKVVPNLDRVRAAGQQPSEHLVTQEDADAALKLREVEVLGIPNGTARGEPAVMIVGVVEGAPAPVIIETTLTLLESAVRAVRSGCS